MKNNNEIRNATHENARMNSDDRMIENLEFLERLEAGLVSGEERRKFADELMTDEDARARYTTMLELGLFGETEEVEEGQNKEREIVATASYVKGGAPSKTSFSRILPWVASAAVLVVVAGVYFNPNPTNQPGDQGASIATPAPASSSFQPGALSLGKWYFLNGSAFAKGMGERPIDDAGLNEMTDAQRFEYIVKALTPDPEKMLTNSASARKAYDACSEEAKFSADGKLLLGLIEFDSSNYEAAEFSFRLAADAYEKSDQTLMREEARFNLAMALISQSYYVEDEQIKEGKRQEAKSIYESLSQEYREKLPEETRNELEKLDDALD